uniref:Uncharacterized protein n=1 Tax=Chromera velia CCMP2878 TaxID=1169474 RepID=A0A0G4IAS3_9ALVE|eukprot:Cvel_12648.t1-p1 / transcript=Cvel_12648.t1 / gene=Cvel_12648 / organism=Chromera_velia_CCMP2878 / gene_product=hypothetical protein / transcript_product=hypothetical protein / location=Cvel_scaffold835:43346-48092(+) / protein_length=674 / sequence_SO=supercontig / SO=protein_coding / is_pseudo=false
MDLAGAVEEAEACVLKGTGRKIIPEFSDAQMADLKSEQALDAAEEHEGVREAKKNDKALKGNKKQKGRVAKTLKRWRAWVKGRWKKVKSFRFSKVRASLSKKYKLWEVARSRAKLAGVLKKYELIDPTAKCFRTLRRLPQVKRTDFDLLTFCKLTTDQVCGEAYVHMDGATLENTYKTRPQKLQGNTITEQISDRNLAKHSNATSKDFEREYLKQHEDPSATSAPVRDQYDAFHMDDPNLSEFENRFWTQKESFRYAQIRACHHMLIHKTYVPMEKMIKDLIWQKRKNLIGITLKFFIIAGAVTAAVLVPPTLGLSIFATAGLGTAIAVGSFAGRNAVDYVTGQEDAFSFAKIKKFGMQETAVYALSIGAQMVGIPAVPILRGITGVINARTQMHNLRKKKREVHQQFEDLILPDGVLEGEESLASWTKRKNTAHLTRLAEKLSEDSTSDPEILSDDRCLSPSRPPPPKEEVSQKWKRVLNVVGASCKLSQQVTSFKKPSLRKRLQPSDKFEFSPRRRKEKSEESVDIHYPMSVWDVKQASEAMQFDADSFDLARVPERPITEEEIAALGNPLIDDDWNKDMGPGDASGTSTGCSCELDESVVRLLHEEKNDWDEEEEKDNGDGGVEEDEPEEEEEADSGGDGEVNDPKKLIQKTLEDSGEKMDDGGGKGGGFF